MLSYNFFYFHFFAEIFFIAKNLSHPQTFFSLRKLTWTHQVYSTNDPWGRFNQIKTVFTIHHFCKTAFTVNRLILKHDKLLPVDQNYQNLSRLLKILWIFGTFLYSWLVDVVESRDFLHYLEIMGLLSYLCTSISRGH